MDYFLFRHDLTATLSTNPFGPVSPFAAGTRCSVTAGASSGASHDLM